VTLILYYVAFMIGGAFAAYFPSHNFGGRLYWSVV